MTQTDARTHTHKKDRTSTIFHKKKFLNDMTWHLLIVQYSVWVNIIRIQNNVKYLITAHFFSFTLVVRVPGTFFTSLCTQNLTRCPQTALSYNYSHRIFQNKQIKLKQIYKLRKKKRKRKYQRELFLNRRLMLSLTFLLNSPNFRQEFLRSYQVFICLARFFFFFFFFFALLNVNTDLLSNIY